MSPDIAGSEFLTGALDVISQSLNIPVIVILLVLVIVSIIMFGGFISEYTSRKKISIDTLSDIIFDIHNTDSCDSLNNIIDNTSLPKSQKRVLIKIINSETLDPNTRESLARKLVEHEEEKIDKTLEKSDIVVRIGPTLGLMGTLIPMGPGLAALGAGDINTLANALTVAFNTTIVGIGCGALSYVISKIRRGWYDQYLSDLDALSDAVLEFMKQF